MKKLRAFLLSLASAAVIVGCGGGGGSDPSVNVPDAVGKADLPASAVKQIEALIAEKAARTPAQRKISSQLLYAKSNRFPVLKHTVMSKGGEPQTGLRSLMRFDDQGRVLADIKGDVDANLDRQVELAGGTVVTSSVEHRSMRAWLPLATLESLADHPAVKAIRPALLAETALAKSPWVGKKAEIPPWEQRAARMQAYLKTSLEEMQPSAAPSVPAVPGQGTPRIVNAGSVTSEGSAAHAADRARRFFGTDGTGITVGVLSDSNDGMEASIASGDLPADTVAIPGQDGRPGSGEGTAMMEIVHDVAPGAKIVFASAFLSPESFADNIRRLRFEFGCDIIVDDVIYFFENPFQDDIIAQAVEDVTLDGALYFSSAGNEGNLNDGTSGTWEGDFKNGGTLDTLDTVAAGYRVHDFGSKVISNRIELDGGPLIMHWSDGGDLDTPTSSNDYDLFVLSPDLREVVVAATDIQDGDDLPFEFLGFLIPPDFRVVVGATPTANTRAIRVEHFRGELGIATDGASYGHNQVKTAFGVAAVDAFHANGGEFSGGPTTPVEIFSADGDRYVFFERDGTQIRGGDPTFAGPAGENRKKPEVAGADGVVTTLPPFSGLNPFFGTSAAAPHVAAVAALIKSAVPTATNTKIYNSLKQSALDIEAQGVDRDSGNGIVTAFGALQKAGAKPAVFLELGAVTATPTSGTAIVPGGSATLTIELANNGGATASSVQGTLFTSMPGVTITQATASYPNIAPGASATNSVPFAFNIDPSVPCGTPLLFTYAASFTGKGTNPTFFTVSVQTGVPDATPTVTSYTGPVVPIPDSTAAGVNVPLLVAGPPSLADVQFSIDGTACSTAIGSTTVGVDHTWVGDLIFKLTSPGGTTVNVINRAGGSGNSGNNFCQTVLSDAGATSIQSVTSSQAPFTGTFSPANPLAAFRGENGNGTWTLNVSDNAFLDTGNIRAFSIATSGFSCPAP